MFGGSMMRDMEEDPFFSMHAQHMRNMQTMFSNPFGMMAHDPLSNPMSNPFMALTDGSEQRARHNPRPSANSMVPHVPNAHMGFGGMFGHMNQMMANMNSMMSGMQSMHRQPQSAQSDPNGQFYSQSTVMSYSNTGQGGQPRMYQATTSTRQAPGGVRETKKSVRDSHTGVEQLAVGRHIGERGHVMERSRNTRTGDLDENEELINLDDTEKGAFNNEWKERTRHYNHQQSRPHHRHRSITEHSRSPYSRNAPLAIEGTPVARRPSPQASQSERTQDHRNQHASSRTYKN